jgi:hypothetical protein
MAKYLQRKCPRCRNGYVGIVMRKPGNTRLQAVNGQCLGCGYRLAWIVIQSKGRSAVRADRRLSIRSNLHSVNRGRDGHC